MCGRYFRKSDKQHIAERFHAGKVFEDPLAADYNIAPTTFQPVIRLSRDSGEREMALLRWGLVPFFATSLKEFKGMTHLQCAGGVGCDFRDVEGALQAAAMLDSGRRIL